jgi:serine/threonine-protein kinase
MTSKPITDGDLIPFLRKRDYRAVKELGYGACGVTILLHDEEIDKFYVCKKYAPTDEQMRQELFSSFLREIKLLYQVHHPSVVRIFTHYIYAQHYAGYIIMEYIDGSSIDDYVAKNPAKFASVFEQVISGFAYLEQQGVLHRDIRPKNILVDSNGFVKIIDLGFGKATAQSADFDKSISLNWFYTTPSDFESNRYDHCTEVYFVGMLMAELARKHGGEKPRYAGIIAKMCEKSPDDRIPSFANVFEAMNSDEGAKLAFSSGELQIYRDFADALTSRITEVSVEATYLTNAEEILAKLTEAHSRCMLEEDVPNPNTIVAPFLAGGSYHNTRRRFPVATLIRFIDLLRSLSPQKREIVIKNIHGRMDAISRYNPDAEDEVPF